MGDAVTGDLSSAIECLRDIASMGHKAGSETARNWLLSHGYALEDGGYVPGRGFEIGCDANGSPVEELP